MTPAQNITRHYGGDWQGHQGAFPTPGHSPSDRGMTVKDADGGGVVFHCHNGDDDAWKSLKDECRQLGLIPERERPQGGKWQQTGCYEYVDADGAVAYRTVRIEKPGERKQFRAQRPDGRSGWINGLDKAAPRILYRLPDILNADPQAIVYLTEGERKADKLAKWGFVATAIAFGAKGWRDAYALSLAGRTVVILPDNDDEGRSFADRAAKSIVAARGHAVVLPLPGLPAKGDIIDWQGSADDLRAITDAALAAPEEPITAPAPMFPLIDPGAWQGMPAPPRAWTLHEWIPARQATYLTGAGSAGKSLLAQQLATCIALGRPFLGVETRQANAIYLTCEDDADELHRRQLAICASMNVEPRSLSGKLHLVSLAGAIGNELAVFDAQGRMGTTEAWAMLHATVMQTGAGFVALDNVAHLFAGNENIRNQVAAFCSLLNRLAADADASVLFIGHPNKAGDNFSGSTAWENQVRSRIFLDCPQDADGEALDPDARQLSRVKANYARNGETLAFRWHEWAFVQENDLAPGVHANIAAVAQENALNDAFVRCLERCTENRRAVSHVNGINYAPRIFAQMIEAKGTGQAAFERAMERLIHNGTVSLDQELWKGDNRHWKRGMKLVRQPVESAPTPALTPAPTHAPTPRQPQTLPLVEERANPRCANPLYTTYKEAGWSPAAPSDESDIIWGEGE